jgi:DNA modification methylase
VQQLESWPTDSLIEYARNPRNNDHAVDRVAAAIREFGFRVPILAKSDKTIVDGHLRLKAAKKLGLEEVPVLLCDDMTEIQVRAFRLSVNKVSEFADWDSEMLRVELDALGVDGFDIELTGFSLDEIADLQIEEVPEGLTDEDAVPEAPDERVTVEGDVWVLGNHRLMCGESTSIDAVEKLMDGQKADMVFTDPPYNIDYQGVKDKRDKIKNDKMSDADFTDFLRQSIMGCETMYVCCSWQYAALFKQAMTDLSRAPKSMIVWNKVNPAQHLDKYFKQHEIIFYYGDFGGHKTLRGDVWEMKRQRNTVHPTMKPVELIDMAMEDQPGKKTVYDGFGGSGSTLISCEKNNRHCRMMELSPAYCDVIINRWQDYTGKEAVLESTGETYNSKMTV